VANFGGDTQWIRCLRDALIVWGKGNSNEKYTDLLLGGGRKMVLGEVLALLKRGTVGWPEKDWREQTLDQLRKREVIYWVER